MPDPTPPLRRSSLWQVVIGCVFVLLMAVVAITDPEHRTPALLVVLLGSVGTWKHYQLWRQGRDAPAVRPAGEA